MGFSVDTGNCKILSDRTYVEHVLHVVNGDEGIVDGDDLDVGHGAGRTEHEATDASEAVDSNFDGSPMLWKLGM